MPEKQTMSKKLSKKATAIANDPVFQRVNRKILLEREKETQLSKIPYLLRFTEFVDKTPTELEQLRRENLSTGSKWEESRLDELVEFLDNEKTQRGTPRTRKYIERVWNTVHSFYNHTDPPMPLRNKLPERYKAEV